MRWLIKDRFMWQLAGLIFIGMGVYNAVATWLQPVLANFGEGGAAGNLIAVLTAGGMSAAGVPPIVAARNQRRAMLVVALALSALAFAATDARHDIVWLGVWFFATGFAIMACLPIVLDWSAIHAGTAREGAAAGFLLMAGNLGGVVLVLVIQSSWATRMSHSPRSRLSACSACRLRWDYPAVRLSRPRHRDA